MSACVQNIKHYKCLSISFLRKANKQICRHTYPLGCIHTSKQPVASKLAKTRVMQRAKKLQSMRCITWWRSGSPLCGTGWHYTGSFAGAGAGAGRSSYSGAGIAGAGYTTRLAADFRTVLRHQVRALHTLVGTHPGETQLICTFLGTWKKAKLYENISLPMKVMCFNNFLQMKTWIRTWRKCCYSFWRCYGCCRWTGCGCGCSCRGCCIWRCSLFGRCY